MFGQREEPLGEGLKVSRPTSTPHLDSPAVAGAVGQEFEASYQRWEPQDVQNIRRGLALQRSENGFMIWKTKQR